MILEFVNADKIRRIIDLNQVVAVIYNPNYDSGGDKVIFYLNGGHSIAFAPPANMDMDLILASVANNMKRKGNE